MTDITATDLSAALLDQKVAGIFHGKSYAYAPVLDEYGWALGVAVEDEQGYHPITGKSFLTRDAAQSYADGLNAHIGLTLARAENIVISSMRRSIRR